MVLRPILDSEVPIIDEFVPAWNAVESREKLNAREWLLITQPDHAALSGEIAAHFASNQFPAPNLEIVRAIALHDAGWALFESDPHAALAVHSDGRPISFFEIQPYDFLRAWTASIDRAAEDSACGAYMVSQHFTWLADFRLRRADDPPAIQQQISAFAASERERQRNLKQNRDTRHWDSFLPLLQFCDIFSLYLCCGSRQPVEFPQPFPAGQIRAEFQDGVWVLSPTPFATQIALTFRARLFSNQEVATDFTSVPISIR